MFKVRGIKVSKIVLIISAVIEIIFAVLMFALADEGQRSSAYYWSREARSAVTLCIIMGLIFIMLAAVEFGLAIGAGYLQKHGKVCPQCERVYAQSVVTCPKCKSDMIYAKSVNEVLSSKPAIADARPTMQSVGKNFCPACGAKIEGNVVFCPQCGNKV